MNVLSWENVSKLAGQTMLLQDGAENEFELEVEAVTANDSNGVEVEGRVVEHYTIVLVGPNDADFPQGNYLLSHPSMGQQILYMLPGSEHRYTITVDTQA